jgi:hypothetical protein
MLVVQIHQAQVVGQVQGAMSLEVLRRFVMTVHTAIHNIEEVHVPIMEG